LDSSKHSRRTIPSGVLVAAKLVVSVALLALLFSRVSATELLAAARRASPLWLLAGVLVYFFSIVASTWRWRMLLDAQGVHVPRRRLFSSFLIAGFFNNFLPSNIGGDVVRIRDTAPAAQSTTLATTIVLVDRGIGLLGLVLVAAIGGTIAGSQAPIWPSWLWAGFVAGVVLSVPAVFAPGSLGRLLRPLSALHPEWIGVRIAKLTGAMMRFRQRPAVLAACFAGAVVVQALLVFQYLTVAYALEIPITFWDLAVLIPVSFVVQMVPVSINGFGVREATFSFYFSRLGLPIESAVLLSLMATGLMMLFSLSGAALYVSRGGRRAESLL
jgi:uncharacterized membrane protein YbhN (UPF0104 family)